MSETALRDERRVLVCGGREYADREELYETLDSFHETRPFAALIHGAARGADTLAGEWARERGVPEITRPADWQRHGRAAGPIRNHEMLRESLDLVVAFPGGRGTAHMVRIAIEAGLQVLIVNAGASQEERSNGNPP